MVATFRPYSPGPQRQRRQLGSWYLDMSYAGWCHFFYMAVALVFFGEYIITAMPRHIVLLVGALLLLFILVSILEPYLAGVKFKIMTTEEAKVAWNFTIYSLAGLTTAILAVSYIKISLL